MGDRTRETIRLELMLEDASIKLSAVASSLNTVSARAMLTAMIDGETDPLVIADLAKGRMRGKIPDLAQAVTGHFDAHHAQMARSILRRLDWSSRRCKESDEVIADACQPWAHQIELLQTIPGVGEKVAQVIVAETGADMSRFPTAAHLAAWAGLAPAMNESAGKRSPAGTRHGNKWLTAMLVEAAGSVGRMHGKNYLADQHARLRDAARSEPGAGRGRAFDPGLRVLHAATRSAVPRPRPGLAQPTQRRSPHPTARRNSWRGSATPSSSIPPHDHQPGLVTRKLNYRRHSHRRCRCHALWSPIHGSVRL